MKLRITLVAVTVGISLGTMQDAPGQQSDPLVLSFVPTNSFSWDLAVAVEKGFFREEGFRPEGILSTSSVQSVQNVVTGAVNVASSQLETVVDAIEKGASVGIIAAPLRHADWMINAGPGIHSLTDLQGKTIAVSGLRVGEYWLTQRLLENAGLKRGSYAIIQVGTTALKYAALEKGAVAAAVLFQPTASLAESRGFPILAKYDAAGYPTPVYFANKAWAEKGGNARRFTNAITHSHEWLFNPKNKAEALAILRRSVKVADAGVAEHVYEQYFGKDENYTRRGEVGTVGISRLLSQMAGDGQIKQESARNPDKYLLPGALSAPAK